MCYCGEVSDVKGVMIFPAGAIICVCHIERLHPLGQPATAVVLRDMVKGTFCISYVLQPVVTCFLWEYSEWKNM
jgi:hypothetical protein